MEWRTTEMKTSWKEKTINIFVIYIPLIVLVFFVVTPIFWTLSLALKRYCQRTFYNTSRSIYA